MNAFGLALRVLRIDRRTRTSAILTTIGVAVATGLVLLLAALPFATEHRAERAVWQQPGLAATPQYNSAEGGPLRYATSEDYTGDRRITRVDIAVTGDPSTVELPAGVPRLPAPGETLVSPELGRIMHSLPAAQLGDRFGRLTGSLGQDALMYPEQLVALVGHTPEQLPESARARPGFPGGEARADPLLGLLAGVGVVVLLVPSLVLVASSARLTAARRERRLAALRLAGATPGQVAGMVAAETALAASVGALLGLAVTPVLHGLATTVPWGGGTWQAGDFTLPLSWGIPLVLAIPLLVVLAGVLGLRRVLRTPLGAVAGHTPKKPHWWRLFTLPVAGLVFTYGVSSAADDNGMLMLFGLALVVGAAALLGPWLTAAVGGTFVRTWRRPAGLLAGRRLHDDPSGAYRASAGVVLAVFAGALALTVLPSLESLAGGGRTFADNVLYTETDAAHAEAMLRGANAELARYGQTERAVAVGTVLVGSGERSQSALVLDCASAAGLTRLNLSAGCANSPAVYSEYPVAPAELTVRTGGDGAPRPLRPGTAVHRLAPGEDELRGSVFVDPAALPAGLVPEEVSVAVPTTAANREVVRTALVGAAGGEQVQSRELRLDNQQTELADLRRVTVIGLAAAALLAGCSAAIATAGSVMDRRRTFGALIAAGTPVRVLARSLRTEAAMPALVATVGAGVVGTLVGLGLFSVLDRGAVVLSPWILAPVVLGLGVAVLAASVCTPALNRVRAEPLAEE